MERKHWMSGLVGGLLLVGQAHAILLTDRWPGDLNTIRFASQDDSIQIFRWEEDYNENDLVPYPSPDGYGVVNKPSDPGCPAGIAPCYFDKIFDLQGETGIWEFQIGVFNDSPFDWSDFHLEFYDPTFQTALSGVLIDAQNGIFPIVEVMPSAVWFSGATQFSGPEFLQNFITIAINLDQVGPDGSFGIRQIATTVPAPATIVLIVLGLAGLGFQRSCVKTRE